MTRLFFLLKEMDGEIVKISLHLVYCQGFGRIFQVREDFLIVWLAIDVVGVAKPVSDSTKRIFDGFISESDSLFPMLLPRCYTAWLLEP